MTFFLTRNRTIMGQENKEEKMNTVKLEALRNWKCPNCGHGLIPEDRKDGRYWLCKLCQLIFPY